MIECAAFVYKHKFCSKGELIVGNNSYEIIYEPKHSKKSSVNTAKANINITNKSGTTSPSFSANSSGFLLSFLEHLSPIASAKNAKVIHRINIDWASISGLQRINKEIESTKNIKLKEQLIIESTSYPKLYIYQYNEDTKKYEISTQSLRTHYIGLEYDTIHSHNVLLTNNYHKIHKYNLPDINIDVFDDEIYKSTLLDSHPSYSLYLNHALPAWIWIPLLNHTLRVLIERVILLGNIGLFIWTIYQMTKYTSIIKGIYEHIFYPLFSYISQPILKKIYFMLNLMRFHVVLTFFSNIFRLFYNYIPINLLYKTISFFDQHIIQQIISLFTMFYRIFINIASFFLPIVNVFITVFKQCFGLINWQRIIPNFNCIFCKRLSIICDGKCWRLTRFIWKCMKRCCRLCQRSHVLADSSTKILKVGVETINTEQTINTNTASAICNGIRYIWNYCRQIIDIFWLGIGKPIKHSYDFFRYIRSEVGTVVAICIRKCCKKSKEKVKNAGKTVLEEAKKQIKIRKNNKKQCDKDSDDEYNEDRSTDKYTKSDDDIIQHIQHIHNDNNNNNNNLRYRRRKRSKSEEYTINNNNNKKYSAIAGIQYYKEQELKENIEF